MATTEFTHSEIASPVHGLRAFVEAGFARVASAWTAMKNRRSVNRLLEWDSHMLADIGLTEGDVRSALASRLAEDPSYQLRAFSAERKAATRSRSLCVFDA
ncbi:MAG TPA: DUF1127 domain-containing protein [Bauldia sp.]|nr:DUF1127 domain-containing protein [Bauldia sp.]